MRVIVTHRRLSRIKDVMFVIVNLIIVGISTNMMRKIQKVGKEQCFPKVLLRKIVILKTQLHFVKPFE